MTQALEVSKSNYEVLRSFTRVLPRSRPSAKFVLLSVIQLLVYLGTCEESVNV